MPSNRTESFRRTIEIEHEGAELSGELVVPHRARGVVLFAHGSGSSRHSPRNRAVATELERHGFVTLLLDLLTPEEELGDARGGTLRFDIDLLADRLVAAIDWLERDPATRALPIGLFGASTGAAAALVAADLRRELVGAVVSRGGRPDLAGPSLARVAAPVLLVVGGADHLVIELNVGAARLLRCTHEVATVPNATHLFEEPGALEHVARLASSWFTRHLCVPSRGGARVTT